MLGHQWPPDKWLPVSIERLTSIWNLLCSTHVVLGRKIHSRRSGGLSGLGPVGGRYTRGGATFSAKQRVH
jgi:hypothetical protein